jgi:hypothetical protein
MDVKLDPQVKLPDVDRAKRRMSPKKKRVLIALVAIVLAMNTGELYRSFDSWAVSGEASRERSAALASTSTATTPDDARRWLESNGYRVVIWNPHQTRGFIGMEYSSSDGDHLISMGQKQVRRGGWPLEPVWLDLTFRFKTDGTFEDVQVEPTRLKISEPAASSRP